jgi:hypothetical protein
MSESTISFDPSNNDGIESAGLALMEPNWEIDLSVVSNTSGLYNLTLSSEDYGQTALIEVYDLNGRKIDIVSPTLSVGATEQLNLSNLPQGIYLLRVFNGSHQETRKITTF